jgi:type 1 glutamine amidotransferase
VLVITGGHDYDKTTFGEMLSSLGTGVSYQIAEFPDAFQMFQPANRSQYDVLVFYHMWQNITDAQKKDLAECIAAGKPLVVLHHSICAFDTWDEYRAIIGGKYFHHPTVVNDHQYEASVYKHDVSIPVRVLDTTHPVTRGISDFTIFDETYGKYYVSPDVTPLLETNEPTSTPVIGWAHRYGNAKVVALQSGHDHHAYGDNNYRKLLLQAIHWVHTGMQSK